MIPKGKPSRRAASRPISSPAREFEESFLMISASCSKGKSAAALPQGIVDYARSGNTDVNNCFRLAYAMKGSRHKRIVFNGIGKTNKLSAGNATGITRCARQRL